MKTFTFAAGFAMAVVTVPFVVYLYFVSGHAPVATFDHDMPFERILAKKALRARMQREMVKNVPIAGNEASFGAGAQLYREHCSTCHGLPGGVRTDIAKGMYPKPPQFFQGEGVTDDEPGETYWKVANGIRLTGMPGFRETLSETQIWQISVLLRDADKLPTSVMAKLTLGQALSVSK